MTRLLAFALAVAMCLSAASHTRSQTSANLSADRDGVRLSLAIDAREATRIVGLAGLGSQLDKALRLHFLKEIALSADGAPCPATSPAAPAFAAVMRMEIVYSCPRDWRALSLRYDAFFDVARAHIAIVHVEVDGQPRGEAVLSKLSRQTAISRAEGQGPSRPAGFLAFVWMGFEHILEGPDHVLFVLGLLLLARSFWSALAAMTGFTLGHSVTLALGALDAVRVHPPAVEALVAATILCVGLEALRAQGAPPKAVAWAMIAGVGLVTATLTAGAAPVWLCLAVAALLVGAGLQDGSVTGWRRPFAFAAGFGTIHGLAFAETLREVLTPGGGLLRALLGFNLGVEAGQIFVAAVAAGLFAVWRMRHPASAPSGAYLASCALTFGGATWLAARLPFA